MKFNRLPIVSAAFLIVAMTIQFVMSYHREKVELEERIQQLEQDIAAIEQQLSEGKTDDPSIYDRHAALQSDLEQTLTDWENASMTLEQELT